MATANTTAASSATTPDSLITIKVAIDGNNRRFKLPLRDLNATVFPDKLQSTLQLAPDQKLLLERFSDSSNAYLVLDPNTPASYKQLYRAAKAKLKLRIKATVVKDEAEQLIQNTKVTEPPIEPLKNVEDAHLSGTTIKVEEPVKAEEVVKTEEPAEAKEPAGPATATQSQNTLRSFLSSRPAGMPGNICSLSRPLVGFQVSCDSCHKSIADAHFHCSICEGGDYDLCEACVEEGKVCPGDGHWMIKRFVKNGQIVTNNTERVGRKPRPMAAEKTPTVPRAFITEAKIDDVDQEHDDDDDDDDYDERTCNACIRVLPKKVMFTCLDCDDFDLCTHCHVGGESGHHPGHAFKPVVDDDTVSEIARAMCAPGRNVRHNAVCDGCDKTISGVRNKCLDCPDWDFCNKCVVDAAKTHPDHRFTQIFESLSVPKSVVDKAYNYHFGIICDGPLCKGKTPRFYIRGDRYKCALCDDTDFCGVCEAHPSNKHDPAHPLIKFKTHIKGARVSTISEDRNGSPIVLMGDQKWPAGTFGALRGASDTSKETPPPYTLVSRPKEQSTTTAPASPSNDELDAHFVRDLVRDETEYGPNVQFRQVWTLRNPGPHSWPVGCSVRRVGGDNMLDIRRSHTASVTDLAAAAESNATAIPVPPGCDFNFMVSLRAPLREGKHISYWRLKAPDGTAFGHKLWCDINVKVNGSDISNSTTPPAPTHGAIHHRHPFHATCRRPARISPPCTVDPQQLMRPKAGVPPTSGGPRGPALSNNYNRSLADYQMQLMLLEQQNKARGRSIRDPASANAESEQTQAAVNSSAPTLNEAAARQTAEIKSKLDALEEAQNKRKVEMLETARYKQQQFQTMRLAQLRRQQESLTAQAKHNNMMQSMNQANPAARGFVNPVQMFKQDPMPANPDISSSTKPGSPNVGGTPYSMSPKDRNAATAAAAAAAMAAAAHAASNETKIPENQGETEESEEKGDEELQTSQMVFPKLEKESPTSSTTNLEVPMVDPTASPASEAGYVSASASHQTVTETETIPSAAEEEQFETLSAADVELYGASEEDSDEDEDDGEGFLTDEEYDILDASDEEVTNGGASGL